MELPLPESERNQKEQVWTGGTGKPGFGHRKPVTFLRHSVET